MATSPGMHGYATTIWVTEFMDPIIQPNALVFPDPDWSLIGQVISLNGIPYTQTVVELTNLTSDGFAKEKIPGFSDGGQLNFRTNYSLLGLESLYNLIPPAGVGVGFRTAPSWGRFTFCVQFPDVGQWLFRGFMQGIPFTVPEDDRITIDSTIEISGEPLYSIANGI
jgi:hypothetical protein